MRPSTFLPSRPDYLAVYLALASGVISLASATPPPPPYAPPPPAPPRAAPSPAPPNPRAAQSVVPPIFLLPGSGASTLDATFTSPNLQRSCSNGTIWLQDVTNITANASCVQQAFPLSFNATTSLWQNNSNAQLSPHDFGGLTGVIGIPISNPSLHPIWLALVQQLQSQGYSAGKNLFGAPYDWRISFYNLQQIGWYARLQQSIEAAVKANNGTRAIICGHSLGTLASTYFLNTFTTPAWREDYIAAYVSFSGLYAGAAIAFTQFLEGNSFGFNVSSATTWPAVRTWGSLVQRAPIPSIWGNQVLISTQSKNYTASDMRTLLDDISLTQQVATYDRIETSIFNLTANALFVDTYCIMGNSIPTPLTVRYDVPSLNGSVPFNRSSTVYGYGDGNINQISLDECLSLEPVQVLNYTGVDHGGVLGDSRVLSAFMSIVKNYTATVLPTPTTASG